jgi:hypothetical protein
MRASTRGRARALARPGHEYEYEYEYEHEHERRLTGVGFAAEQLAPGGLRF